MKALYGMGIVHRDLKPQNLLLSYASKDAKPSEIKIKIGKCPGYTTWVQQLMLTLLFNQQTMILTVSTFGFLIVIG